MSAIADPADNAVAVSPSDSTSYGTFQGHPITANALYVGTTGNVAVLTAGGQTITFNSVPAGAILPIRHTRVNNTNTTASNMVAFY